MNTKITLGAFDIEIKQNNRRNQLLQIVFDHIYINLLKGAVNDQEITNILFDYFQEEPNTRFLEHYQEINYEEIYARNQFFLEEEEVQGVGIFRPPSYIDDHEIIEIDSDDSESTTQIDSEEESEAEIFITLNQLRQYQEPRYWTDSEPDSEYNYIEDYDSDNSLPYSANLDSE